MGLEFPNVVTPGDPKENNKFRPVIPKDCKVSVSEIDFKIYNRWGAMVYRSNDVSLPGWDGMFKNNPSPSDTYIYEVKYKLLINDVPKDQNFQNKGMFTLVR